MSDDVTMGKIEFEFPIFPDSTKPKGFLSPDKESQACWYYYILCQKQKEAVGSGPESQTIVVPVGQEGSVHWMDTHFVQTLSSLALIYQLSREAILKRFPEVIQEATRLELPEPDAAYMNPKRFVI